MVKRYDLCEYTGWTSISEKDNGDYVKHEDYAAIKAELDKWKSAHAHVVKDARRLSIELVDALDELDALKAELAALKEQRHELLDLIYNSAIGQVAMGYPICGESMARHAYSITGIDAPTVAMQLPAHPTTSEESKG